MYWVYKCNSKDREYQRTYGDWAEVFESAGPQWWGTTKIVQSYPKRALATRSWPIKQTETNCRRSALVVGSVGEFKRLILSQYVRSVSACVP